MEWKESTPEAMEQEPISWYIFTYFMQDYFQLTKDLFWKMHRQIYTLHLKPKITSCATSKEPQIIHFDQTVDQLHSKATPELQPPTIDNDMVLLSLRVTWCFTALHRVKEKAKNTRVVRRRMMLLSNHQSSREHNRRLTWGEQTLAALEN